MRPSGRGILTGLLWLLASLGIMLSSVAVWAHQSLLTSSGWSRVVSDVFDDPEVVAGTSEIVIERVSEAIDLSAQVDRILPGEMNLISGAITGRVEDALAEGLARILSREDVRGALASANAAAHEATIRAIRGGGDVVSTEEGVIALDVFPVIEAALRALQDAGFIDAQREIPDLSEYEPPAETVARLEALLGRELPADLGTIVLVESDRLERVQDVVRAFDLVTIGVLLATLVLAGLALWLSRRRLRMVVWLALGGAMALALGRAVTRLVVEDISGALTDGPEGETVRAVVESALEQVTWVSLVGIAVSLVVAGVAMWVDHRERAAARSAQADVAGVTDETAVRSAAGGGARSYRAWVAAHRHGLTVGGLAVIGLLAIWGVAGPDIALPALAAAGLWLVAVAVVAGRVEDAPGIATGDATVASPGDAAGGDA